ncbi:MAG: hypothetical protein AAFY34_10340 [Pseudomonadota bacterium]
MQVVRHLVSWALSLFLIAMFLQATVHPLPDPPVGSVKLFDLPGENIVFQTLADRSGYVMFEPTGRVATAMLELLAALFLLFPLTRRFGAFISFLVLSGALVLHLSPWLGREIPVSLDPANTATDGGLLFTLAVAMIVASVLVMVAHPRRRRRLRY